MSIRVKHIVSLLLIVCFCLTGCSDNHLSYNEENITSSNVEQYKEATEPLPVVERNMAIIYDDSDNHALQMMTKKIQDKMDIDTFNINDYQNINISDYDVYLIGSAAFNDNPVESLTALLPNIDFQNKDVTFYYIGAFNNDEYESKLISLIQNGNILTSLGFNSDEISETELVDDIMNGWLTSTYHPLPDRTDIE